MSPNAAVILAGALRRGRRPVLALAALAASCSPPGDSTPPETIAFARTSPPLFVASGSLTDAWADFDGDGDPDRFVGFNEAPARLYRNDGADGFRDVAAEVGLAVERSVRTAAWGDADGDGDSDLFLGFAGEAPVAALYRNDRDAGFTDVAGEVGLALDSGATRQASWIDADDDRDLDLFLALRDGPNRLWRNDGERFTDVTAESGLGDARHSVGAAWFDFDEDGDMDVFVANMDGDANGAWRNDGGTFTDVAAELGLADGGRALGDPAQGSVRPCPADFDGDGDLDVLVVNYGPNGLFRNPGSGGGSWENVAGALGLAGDSKDDACAWADVDHDGRLDVFVNGTVTGGVQYPDRLYRRSADGFADAWPAQLAPLALDHGVTWVDFDGDGDLDLSLAGAAEDGSHPLLRNLLRPELAGNSLLLRLLDGTGRATMAGAVVRAYVPGTREVVATALLDTGSGYDAQSVLPVHLGLPGGQPVDVVVTFQGPEGPRVAVIGRVDPSRYRGQVLEARIERK